MNHVELLVICTQVLLFGAAAASTAFPVLYSRSPWRQTQLGRVVMLQAVSFALTVDVTLLFQFWAPSNLYVLFAVQSFLFGLITVASSLLTIMLWRLNHLMYITGKRRHRDIFGRRKTRTRRSGARADRR